jgi:hypothetical protein
MTTSPAPPGHEAIRQLVMSYARACDLRDGPWLASLFAPGAELVVHTPGHEPSLRTAPDGIHAIPDRLSQYDRTFHFVGTHRLTLTDAEATGDAYCFAHHLTGQRDLVMAIHYADRYCRTGSAWQFLRRDVHVLWTDQRELS